MDGASMLPADAWHEYRGLLSDHLGTEDLDPLLTRCSFVDLPDGAVLTRDQGPVDALHLVLEGALQVHVEMAGHTIRLGEILPGNWIGEMAYYSRCGTACSTVTALKDCRLLRLGFADYTALMKGQSEVACRLSHVLIAMLVQRLRTTVNDPVLDPEGQLLMLGDLSVPVGHQAHGHSHVAAFFKNLLGIR